MRSGHGDLGALASLAAAEALESHGESLQGGRGARSGGAVERGGGGGGGVVVFFPHRVDSRPPEKVEESLKKSLQFTNT